VVGESEPAKAPTGCSCVLLTAARTSSKNFFRSQSA
jgi:hypothetical protein